MKLIPDFVRNAFARSAPPRAPQQRRFSGAQISRFTADWFVTEQSINQELRLDLNGLRKRGREMTKNNDYAKKFCGMVKNNIIGPKGFTYQSRVENKPGQPDDLANDSIESAYDRWKKVCDVTGHMHFDDMCACLVGGLPSDGEFIVRMVLGADAGNEFNFALQVIDVDRLDTLYNVAPTSGTNAVIMGVEVNLYRRPVAYWMFAAHPNDGIYSSRNRVRVPAEEIIHFFQVEYAEQIRGIPWMASGMLSLHHLSNFMSSAVLAAENGANHFGFFTTPDGVSPVGAEDGETSEQITTSQPGIYDTLPAGTTFTPHQSAYPAVVVAPFIKSMLQRVATGWRVDYVSLGNDLEGVSFSSIRSGTIEVRDRWRADQRLFINDFLDVIQPIWIKMSLLSGAITMPNGSALPASKIDKFRAHEWQPRSWDWVDPLKDIEANIAAINAGIRNPQDVAAQAGTDFADNVKKLGQANKLAEAAKVQLTAYIPKAAANYASADATQTSVPPVQ